MRTVIYNQGVIVSESGVPDVTKTVYSKADFVAAIPKPLIRQIQNAAQTNNDINVWIFNLQMLQDSIDLNKPPDWFVEGIDAMVTEGLISQNNADTFLER